MPLFGEQQVGPPEDAINSVRPERGDRVATATGAKAAEVAAAPDRQQRVMLPWRPGWHQDCA
jgi:hypothetical protein